MKKNFSILLFLTLSTFLTAQSYKFTFNVKNAPNALCKLGYYKGESTVVIDSAKIDSIKQEVVFKGEQRLKNGQYFFFVQGKGILDFIVNDEYKQTFTTYGKELMDSVKVKGSRENEAYFKYLSFARNKDKKVENFRRTLDSIRQSSGDRKALGELEREVRETSRNSQEFEKNFIAQNAELFTAKLIKSKLMPVAPKNLPALGWDNKPNMAYHVWLNRHFWDEFDFNDNRLLYSRIYPHKLQAYFEQYSSARPDSVVQSADILLSKCKQNPEVFRYCLDWIKRQMEVRKTGGSDNIYVHLFDNYYAKNNDLLEKDAFKQMKEKADLYRPNLINAIAPEISLPNPKDSTISLNSIKSKFTVLYLLSSTSPATETKLPILVDATKDYIGKGVEVIAVSVEDDKKVWTSWVEKNANAWNHVFANKDNEVVKNYAISSYPMIYILDDKKKIIGKNIKAEELARLLKLALAEKKN